MQVKDIKKTITEKYKNKQFVIDKTGCKTIEIINASFVADKEFILRSPNYDYIKRELDWYESQSLDVNDIGGETPAIWKAVSDKDGKINSNYGYLIYSKENYSQYLSVLAELGEDPNSRRANMIYTRPNIHIDAFSNGMSDFICTNNVQYFIRDNQLITSVNMRSNDAVFGYNNDFAWQKHVRDKLIDDLETDTYNRYEAGPIYWNVGSLHVYERHFGLIKKEIEKEDERQNLHILTEETLGDGFMQSRMIKTS